MSRSPNRDWCDFGRISLGFMLAMCASLAAMAPAHGQQAKDQDRPEICMEQLTAMLHSIDPYRENAPAKGKIAIFGSTSMDAMAHAWAQGFKRFHPQAEIMISAAGSEKTFDQLLQNPTGLGMLSRPVTDAELANLQSKGLKKPTAFIVAREALGVFVHPGNPVKTISGEQLRAVFTVANGGQAPTWKMLGATGEWAEQPIHVVSRTTESGTQKFLADFVFQSSQLREGVSSHSSNAEVLAAIGKDPLAIGICGLRSNHNSVQPLQLVSGANVIPSDDHAILCGQYPLTRPLTMLLDVGQTGEEALAAQEFVHYAMCRAAQAESIVVGFFPVDLPLLRAGLQKLGATQLK